MTTGPPPAAGPPEVATLLAMEWSALGRAGPSHFKVRRGPCGLGLGGQPVDSASQRCHTARPWLPSDRTDNVSDQPLNVRALPLRGRGGGGEQETGPEL